MEQISFLVNPGSASKKYAIYRGLKPLLTAHFEAEAGKLIATFTFQEQTEIVRLAADEYRQATGYTLNYAKDKGIIAGASTIEVIGLRIVAPGQFFTAHKPIDNAFREKIAAPESEIPLHITPLLEELDHLRVIFPEVSILGLSDSAFHTTLPETAKLYALPLADSKQYGLFRFCYHFFSF